MKHDETRQLGLVIVVTFAFTEFVYLPFVCR